MSECLPPLLLTVLLVDFVGNRPRLGAVFHVAFTFVLCYIAYLYPKPAWDMSKHGINTLGTAVAEWVNCGIAFINDIAMTNITRVVFVTL